MNGIRDLVNQNVETELEEANHVAVEIIENSIGTNEIKSKIEYLAAKIAIEQRLESEANSSFRDEVAYRLRNLEGIERSLEKIAKALECLPEIVKKLDEGNGLLGCLDVDLQNIDNQLRQR